MIEATFIIREIIEQAYNVKSFRLEINNQIDFKAGQFLEVILKEDKEYRRYISFSSSPTEKCYIEFTKKITQSNFSKTLDNLKPGDSLKIQYPLGKFTLEDNPGKKIAFISGGIGITPIRSIIKFVVDKKLDKNMVLVYANRSIKDIIFHDDLELMQKEFNNFKLSHVLCEPVEGFKCSVGLINSNIIKNEVLDYMERKFFLCGPPTMVGAMKTMLVSELNITQENIITENFIGY